MPVAGDEGERAALLAALEGFPRKTVFVCRDAAFVAGRVEALQEFFQRVMDVQGLRTLRWKAVLKWMGDTVPQRVLEAALCGAAHDGDLGAVHTLVQAGADVRCEDGRPLFEAAARGHVDVVRFLLQHEGVDPQQAQPQGWTPIHVAAHHGHHDVLGEFGTLQDVNMYTTTAHPAGHTPLMLAASANHTKAVDVLLRAPGCTQEQINAGCATTNNHMMGARLSALHLAAQHGNAAIVQQLLAPRKAGGGGMDPNQLLDTSPAWRAIHHAAQSGDFDTVTVLLQAGASATVRTFVKTGRRTRRRETAATIAQHFGHHDLAQFLAQALKEQLEHQIQIRQQRGNFSDDDEDEDDGDEDEDEDEEGNVDRDGHGDKENEVDATHTRAAHIEGGKTLAAKLRSIRSAFPGKRARSQTFPSEDPPADHDDDDQLSVGERFNRAVRGWATTHHKAPHSLRPAPPSPGLEPPSHADADFAAQQHQQEQQLQEEPDSSNVVTPPRLERYDSGDGVLVASGSAGELCSIPSAQSFGSVVNVGDVGGGGSNARLSESAGKLCGAQLEDGKSSDDGFLLLA